MAPPSPLRFYCGNLLILRIDTGFQLIVYTNRQTGREAPERDSLYPVPVLQKALVRDLVPCSEASIFKNWTARSVDTKSSFSSTKLVLPRFS